MLVIVGASASGKTEIANALVSQYAYIKSVTTTTRQQRGHEMNHIHYHFVSKKQFQTLKKQDAFIETTRYQEHDYGLQKNEIGSHHIIILDPNGCNSIYQKYPNETCVIYIQSNKEMRQTRMLSRGDDIHLISKRLNEDDVTFQVSHLDKIHLIIDNHHQTIISIAEEIHHFYQSFLKGD
jgi:guanylate kinase